ncbi:MAG: hypothetical protein MZV63_42245 [Marinilabiliales bacterium]|nr:hypothetical protein [Marinilabiliales bacterium]
MKELKHIIEELNDPDLERILERYNPADTIVFNLCETLTGYPEQRKKSSGNY